VGGDERKGRMASVAFVRKIRHVFTDYVSNKKLELTNKIK